MRNAKMLIVATVLALCAYTALGFTRFVDEIRSADLHHQLPEADGVVVLTGGAKRLEAAINLFEASHGQRMLISGVGKETTRGDLGRLLDKTGMMFGCCVDIDRRALDTKGNAKYTAEWVQLNGFSRLLVVTSSYHMPRSMMLMKRRMPDVELVGVPVYSSEISGKGFWDLVASPVILTEYAKYMIASMGFEPPMKTFRAAIRSLDFARG